MATGGEHHTISTVVGIILAVMGVGTVALLVSSKAQTGNVFTNFGQAVSKMICTALSPVTGNTCASVASTVATQATQVTSTFCVPGIDPGCPGG